MESIDLDSLEPISINLDDKKETNFGGGIELLMNEKKVSTQNTKIDLGDIDKLEDDLNDLSTINLDSTNFQPKIDIKKDDFPSSENINIVLEDTDSKIGSNTIGSMGNTNTWDGFQKFSSVPNKTSSAPPVNLSERDKKRKKRTMLKSLNDWQEKGWLKEGSRLTMDSSFEDIEDEYESALEDKRKRDSVKIQQNWMITFINTIEYGNAFFDPFGISLDGWGESVSEDVDSYNEIFEELYDKYKGGKMSPELSLLLRLGFSASVVHFSNKALSSATPGFNDVIKQSPELMRMFTNATVESMKQNTPGMAFAEELLNTKPNTSNGPPPAPVETRAQEPPTRPGAMQFTDRPTNRPDLNAGKSTMNTMFKESGVELNKNVSINEQPKTPITRPEMTGPKNTDIDNILSGLKPKAPPAPQSPPKTTNNDDNRVNVNMYVNNDEDSMISVTSLKELEGNIKPKKSKRRNTSDKKVVSLDL